MKIFDSLLHNEINNSLIKFGSVDNSLSFYGLSCAGEDRIFYFHFRNVTLKAISREAVGNFCRKRTL